MKLPEEFNGYVNAKVVKIFNFCYNIDKLSNRLNKIKSTKINVTNYKTLVGTKYINVKLNNIDIKTIYDDDIDLYESMNDEFNFVFIIQIQSICD